MATGFSDFEVIILGAGVAGLVAARTFLRRSFSSFLIVDARDRVGGRLHCARIVDAAEKDEIDLGASYVHGKMYNPVYELSARHGEVLQSSNGDGTFYFTPDLRQINAEATQSYMKGLEDVFNRLRHDRAICYEPDKTVGDLLNDTAEEVFDNELPDPGLTRSQKTALLYSFTWMECLDSANEDPFDLTAAGYYDAEKFEGNQYIFLRKGYSTLLNRLMKDISPSTLRLRTVVKKIAYSDLGCRLTVVSGDSKCTSILTARHLICTLPLGVLKSNTVTFSPELPDWKQTAIDSLGFGTVDRLVFFFDKRWWPEDVTNYRMAVTWTEDSNYYFRIKCQKPSVYKKAQHMEWYRHMIAFEVVPTVTVPMLAAYVIGTWAEVVEYLPDSEILAVASEIITRVVSPHYDYRAIPPVKLMRSKWYSDPYARGSYTHISLNATSSHCEALTEALPLIERPTLFFAGEATHEKYFGTVHGAWLSGERDAKRILTQLGY